MPDIGKIAPVMHLSSTGTSLAVLVLRKPWQNEMSTTIKVTITNGSEKGVQYVFDESKFCVIGRAMDCAIHLPDIPEFSDISRHHCAIHIDPPIAWVNDLASMNGTYVNDVKIDATSGKIELHHNDELRVGPLVLRISYERKDDVLATQSIKPVFIP